jgi:hypothetical protein
MKHTIDPRNDFKDFTATTRLAGSENKALDAFICFDGVEPLMIFKVSVNNICVFRCAVFEKAVKAYNNF